ncbi:hypothetical protein C7I84_21515 [Mesorhizobium ephedrae]|uniref:DUF2188 domain-containing protein n=1 Tax=Kumtagia ephedrae TaxID=2116701 RepID=A0A2P7S104_9HYPH|nr:hypothetical protein C7I84_21515 [Mesorhizobium ephedrae]
MGEWFAGDERSMDEPMPDGVLVEEIGGRWAVRVIEQGKVVEKVFEEEEAARDHAWRERLRLNLGTRPDGRLSGPRQSKE